MWIQRNFSLYMLSSSHVYEVAVFYTGFLVTIAYTLGYRTRIASVLFWLFTYSLFQRNPFLLDGGDNLLYLLAFYMMFTDCGAHFSLDARAGRVGSTNEFVALIHNFGVLAVLAQITLLYFTSAFYKIQGKMWQDGTAIYYILRSVEFRLSPLAYHFYRSDVIVTLLTWSTMIFQMSWPFLIWNRRTKLIMALGALSLHTMIAYFMGLVWFSAVMITAELMIFTDSEYWRFSDGLQRLFALRRSAHETPLVGWVLYDNGCGFCSQWVRSCKDIIGRYGLGIKDLPTAWSDGNLKLAASEVLDDIRVLTLTGEMYSGADAYLYLTMRIWWARPLGRLFRLPVVNPFFRTGYRWFNRNRHRISGYCGLQNQKEETT
jgi:predicted DCC family thiol-disulfide oxidoreductase YuxK